MEVTFFGVRGSTPCSGPALQRYGGNTACVVIERRGRTPIILDMGTGLRVYGSTGVHASPFRATALVSHLHWDHVQGIPFFAPLLCDGAHLDVYGPAPDDGRSLGDAVRTFVTPPFFPVGVDDLPAEIVFHDAVPGEMDIDGAKITVADVPHVGPTLGYRVEAEGVSVAYISDHQQPGVGSAEVDPGVLALAEGVDLLIHDAQFDSLEFSMRPDWGHCSIEYAVEVAARAGAGTLALFHHDPSHTDDRVDELLVEARAMAERRGVPEVVAAHQGLTVSYDRVHADG